MGDFVGRRHPQFAYGASVNADAHGFFYFCLSACICVQFLSEESALGDRQNQVVAEEVGAAQWQWAITARSFLLPYIEPLFHFRDDLALLVDHIDAKQRLDLPLPIGLGA